MIAILATQMALALSILLVFAFCKAAAPATAAERKAEDDAQIEYLRQHRKK